MILEPTPCTRCGSRTPNPGCVVCADEEHLRDEMLDRTFGGYDDDDVGPDMDDFIKTKDEP
jgi:hypothetical protein